VCRYERNMDFYAWCRQNDMYEPPCFCLLSHCLAAHLMFQMHSCYSSYIHAPDPYYFRGINKDGMGYVETNWNLPLWEQVGSSYPQNVGAASGRHSTGRLQTMLMCLPLLGWCFRLTWHARIFTMAPSTKSLHRAGCSCRSHSIMVDGPNAASNLLDS